MPIEAAAGRSALALSFGLPLSVMLGVVVFGKYLGVVCADMLRPSVRVVNEALVATLLRSIDKAC